MQLELGAQRYDGKYNVWRRYGDQHNWSVIKVYPSKQQAENYISTKLAQQNNSNKEESTKP